MSALLGGLSMLAKETGITVMLVNLTYDLYRSWHFIKRYVKISLYENLYCRSKDVSYQDCGLRGYETVYKTPSGFFWGGLAKRELFTNFPLKILVTLLEISMYILDRRMDSFF
jgi:hypothetical protein